MDRQKSQQFMQKVVGDVGTALAAALVIAGDNAGLFRAMAGAGPLTAAALASRCGIHARYAEEWLGAMACAGYVEHDAAADTFTLPDEHAAFLTDPASETYLGGLFTGLPGLMAMAPRLGEAFRRGDGIPFAEFGAGLPVALEAMNRSVYENRLARTWLPTMPAVVAALASGGRAIDVGCGTGVVPIALARAFPQARIDGLDLDARSIAIARGYAEAAGVAGRVRFIEGSADALAAAGPYDFICTFDVIHDLPDPVGVLRAIRGALAAGGTYLMVEPRMGDRLEDNLGNPFGRMLYAISCLHCVPQSLAQGGPGLGACWGPARARALATEAGFGEFLPLPIRSPAMAFYALR
ncbi:MAG: methyltransferase domain-containing protein [Burkholderiales bacterium]|nr:methyltransferase domain-containing protein [Burkholderiales bacterium]